MSLMDMFKPKAAEPSNNNQQQQQGQQAPANQQGQQGQQQSAITQGQADPANNPANNTKQAENPLDQFKGMFDNTSTDADKVPSFVLPSDKVNDVASKMNFTQGINPELMQKAMAGDAQSMMEIINNVGQQAYARSIEHTATLSDNFINQRLAHEGKTLNSKVKEQLTSAELQTKTPGFDNPVVKAQLSSTARELARMYPDATPQEIAQKARDYITTLANSINPQATTAPQQESAKDVDWDKYF